MTLAERVAARLAAAGIREDDPALEQIAEWNRQAALRARREDAGFRKRPFGYKVAS